MHEKTILIADNSIINRMQMGGILASEYNILEADNGRDALDIMCEHGADGIDAVLLDLHMPGQDGYDVLAEKQLNPAIADIPVIVITADSVTAAEVRALDLGASDFLTKPIEPEIMRRRVRLIINAREFEEQRMRVRMLEEAAWITDHDDLTGLYTRKAFLREMADMIALHPDTRYLLAVWDFDNFKLFNELFGTAWGDRMLNTAADSMRTLLGHEGVYGRMGNDFFAFCVPQEGGDVSELMQSITDDVARLLEESNNVFTLALTAGVYLVEDTAIETSVMLDRAMMAQRTIKGDYDNHIAFYNTELTERMLEEQDIINNMEGALANGEFHVQLQPVYDIAAGRPVSAEALVRWHRPGHGIVSPGVFVPLFEENGFIAKMDHYVWEQVCQIIADRRDRGLPEIPISVNLSRRSIYSSSLYDEIVELVERYGVKPSLFRIEVTESSYIENLDLAIAVVKRLQDYGFTILMDDFGSGYSSFNALKDIPVDILKADMVFMRNFERDGRIASIFTSIVRMARWLGIPVIAEGVETFEQYEFLRSIGCRYTQGFYFARPMSLEDFEEHIAEYNPDTPENRSTFSNEDVNKILGGNHLFDTVFDDALAGFAVLEWSGGQPEVVRVSEGFRDILGIRDEEDQLEQALVLGSIAPGDQDRFLEACREAIDARGSADVSIGMLDTSGTPHRCDITIVCITSNEVDAMLFMAIRK